jgi:transcriptional regulator with XRE-family HTH domain
MEKTTQELGNLIKQARKRMGLSQQELAVKLGWTRPYVAMLENARASAKGIEDRIEKLALHLGEDENRLRLAQGLSEISPLRRNVLVPGDWTEREIGDLKGYVHFLDYRFRTEKAKAK